MKSKNEESNIDHQEHLEWLSTLNFYQDEIKVFQNQLYRVLNEHVDLFSIIEHVDEYRRILILKIEHIDELRSKIALHEHSLIDQMQLPGKINHQNVKEEMMEFVDVFEDLKKRLRRFIVHQLQLIERKK